jgi:8-oxo-dGTP pyrophosphatase MutT (NUDIX family)
MAYGDRMTTTQYPEDGTHSPHEGGLSPLLKGNVAAHQAIYSMANHPYKWDPDTPSEYLGKVLLDNGELRNAWVIHAADAVATDGNSVLVIDRKEDPGQGKAAIPGGFIDPIAEEHRTETSKEAAIREAREEAGIDLAEHATRSWPIGERRVAESGPVRQAYNDALAPRYGLKKGDLFVNSCAYVGFEVPNLQGLTLTAGTDAENPRPITPGSLKLEDFAFPSDYALMQSLRKPDAPAATVMGAKAHAGTATLPQKTRGQGGGISL